MEKDLYSAYSADTRGKKIHVQKGKSQKKKLKMSDFIDKEKTKEKVEVITMNINQTITFKEFKNLSKTTQQHYLDHLHSIFNVGTREFAEMMGTSPKNFSGYCRKEGLESYGIRGRHKLSAKESQNWLGFLASNYAATFKEESTAITEAPVNEVPFDANDINTEEINSFVLNSINVNITTKNMEQFIEFMGKFIQDNAEYNIVISRVEK